MINQNFETNSSDRYLLKTLNEYAVDVLRQEDGEVGESLKRREIPLSQLRPLAESYKISLHLGKNLSSDSIREILQEQIKAIGLFIREFQVGVLGQRTSLFHLYEVEINIDNTLKSDLSFDSGKLVLQIPYWQMLVLKRYLTFNEVKNAWSRGEHLPKFSPSRKYWWLLNPIGELRANLRAMLVLAMHKEILGIDQLFMKFGLIEPDCQSSVLVEDMEGNNDKFKESAIAFLQEKVNEEKLGVNLDAILQAQDEKILIQLLGLFKKNLADPAQMEELVEAGVLTLQEEIQAEQSQVDVKMFGFVNIGNYNRINVALNVSAGYLKKYVEVMPINTDVKAVQFGFLNIYTIDDITVKPNFHGALTLNFETAALAKALKELELIKYSGNGALA